MQRCRHFDGGRHRLRNTQSDQPRHGSSGPGWGGGIIVGIGAGGTTAKLLNLTQAQLVHAIGIAAVSNITLRATRVGSMSMWRGSATAQPARNGVFAAFLAQEGMTGPSEPFEGAFGLWQEIANPFDL